MEFLKFLEKLKISDFAGARNILVESIKVSATVDVLKTLAGSIHLDKNIEIFMTGFQITDDGNQYPMVQFKYTNDISPPKEVISVLFDENGNILGIKPMKQLN